MTPIEFNSWLASAPLDRSPIVMGILNVTPDSFSDGGRFIDSTRAIEHAIQMTRAGAGVVDVGGESTRPGAAGTPAEEQLRRVIPVVAGIRSRCPDITLSIDTTSAEVAAVALDAGASIINDVSAGRDDQAMFSIAAARSCPIVLMHRLGSSQTMQNDPQYDDVLEDVARFLLDRRDAAVNEGVSHDKILLDPGIGFGKTTAHDVRLITEIKRLCSLDHAVVVGVSRKKFIGLLTGQADPVARTFGTAAAVACCVSNGAAIVRVHDVKPMMDVVAVAAAFRAKRERAEEKISR